MKIPEHIVIDEDNGTADCTVCFTGLDAPESFGGIPRATLLANFVVQHVVHKGRMPTGLTASGKPSKAAREAMA